MASFGQFETLGPFTTAIGGGWKLYHYIAGTTTTKDLWSDRGKTTTVAQPLLADANGVMSFYADGLYDFVAKDSNGVTLYTWNNAFYGSLESTNHTEGAALSSASTLILGSDGDYFHVTGTTQINAIQGTQPFVFLTFDSALTLAHSSSLVLKGAVNHPVIASETLVFMNDGSNVFREIDNGVPMKYSNNTWTGSNSFTGTAAFSSTTTFSGATIGINPTIPAHLATKTYVEKRAADSTVLANGFFDASISSNALTISLLTQAGTAPTTDDVVSVAFRASIPLSAAANVRTVTAATTVTVSAGSTLGFSASQLSRIYIVALDNSGTVELAVYHPLSGTTHLALDEGLYYSTTAEGGSGGADSAQVLYSTAARTGVPIAILGYVDIQTGSTAGNWNVNAVQYQAITPSTPRSGRVIQRLLSASTAVQTTTTALPYDDTIPQNTEGGQFFSQAITPKHAADLLLIACVGTWSAGAAADITVALFQDSTASALAAAGFYRGGADQTGTECLIYQMQAGTTSATTFKIRAGAAGGQNVALNGKGAGSTRIYGGVCYSALMVMEIFL